MFTRTKKPRSAGQTVASRAAAAEHKRFTYSWQESTAFRLHGANTGPLTEAERRPDEIDTNSRRAAGLAPGHDFSVIPVFAKPPAEGAARELVTTNKFENQQGGGVHVSDKDPDPGKKKAPSGETPKQTPPAATSPGGKPSPAPATKRAGVESFWVHWAEDDLKKHPSEAKLVLQFQAKFKDDQKYDPAVAEFRQLVFHKLEVVKGPHTSPEVSTAPLHDDGYSRKDDQGNHTIHDNYFLGSDNPGPKDLDKDDVIKYSFTAEQRIIDTSDGDKVIKTLGPYTAGINGKHPRTPWGVPKMIGK